MCIYQSLHTAQLYADVGPSSKALMFFPLNQAV